MCPSHHIQMCNTPCDIARWWISLPWCTLDLTLKASVLILLSKDQWHLVSRGQLCSPGEWQPLALGTVAFEIIVVWWHINGFRLLVCWALMHPYKILICVTAGATLVFPKQQSHSQGKVSCHWGRWSTHAPVHHSEECYSCTLGYLT